MYIFKNFLLVFFIENNSIADYAQTFGEIWKVQLKIIKIIFTDVTVKCIRLRKHSKSRTELVVPLNTVWYHLVNNWI